MNLNWPLMYNNITDDDADVLIKFLSQRPLPILTNGPKVKEFEKAWSDWLGIKYSIFVNSGSSANILTMLLIKELYGNGEIITSPFGWVSDIASILHAELKPVFVDITMNTLTMNNDLVMEKFNKNTKGVLLTHILGYNGLTRELVDNCKNNKILLIEDACEAHGAIFGGKKLGSIGDISNFSFFYAHHLSTIEGGMICTNNETVYNYARSFRSHGMLREMESNKIKQQYIEDYIDLNKDFIFTTSAYNMRSTELNAVIGLNQLKRLDANNIIRKENLKLFLDNLDKNKYYTDFYTEGNSNYALTLLLREKNFETRDKVENVLKGNGVEFRRGMSGGGDQLRQPYLRKIFGNEYQKYPNCNHIHHFSWYIGNYPELEKEKIFDLCKILNGV